MALIRGLTSFGDPKTYERMFLGIDSDEVVLVSGEQDNVFVPGLDGGGDDDDDDDVVSDWEGLESSPAEIHVMVRGWAAASEYLLVGEAD